MSEVKTILTIAGSDPSGGAGIQADIKTATRLGVYPFSVVTAITAQNSSAFLNAWPVDGSQLKSQLEAVLSDYKPDGVKIGLIASHRQVDIIADAIQHFGLTNIVLDPVLAPTLTHKHPDIRVMEAMAVRLFPVSTLVTPNRNEADTIERETGLKLDALCSAFLIKGGDSEDKEEGMVTDTLYFAESEPDDEPHRGNDDFLTPVAGFHTSSAFPTVETHPFVGMEKAPGESDPREKTFKKIEFSHARIKTSNTHGSGCVLSSAIACCLALGQDLPTAVENAEKFVETRISESASIHLGKGKYGPLL